MKSDLTQALIFIAATALFGYAYFNLESRNRLATSSWQPVPAVASLVLALCYVVMALNSFVHHRIWIIQVLFAVLFTVAGVWQLLVVRNQDQTPLRRSPRMGGISDGDILGEHFSGLMTPRFVIDRLGNDDATVRLTVSARSEVVRNAAATLAMDMGELIGSEPDIVAKVGTGLFGLNPAVLHLRCSEAAEGTTTMEVAATAKEGLIKQRGGHQAVDRFVERFRELAPREWDA